jgi:hypothetical protein
MSRTWGGKTMTHSNECGVLTRLIIDLKKRELGREHELITVERLPDRMVPDISTGKMFCGWLRKAKGLDTSRLPTYTHKYADGHRITPSVSPSHNCLITVS